MSLYVCTTDHRHSRWWDIDVGRSDAAALAELRGDCLGFMVRAADSVSALAALAGGDTTDDFTGELRAPAQNRVLDVLQAFGYPASGAWRADAQDVLPEPSYVGSASPSLRESTGPVDSRCADRSPNQRKR